MQMLLCTRDLEQPSERELEHVIMNVKTETKIETETEIKIIWKLKLKLKLELFTKLK